MNSIDAEQFLISIAADTPENQELIKEFFNSLVDPDSEEDEP
ncbi:hypothetical protein PAECIP112173_00368 [Paenibacillus sp. JJ-100]|nr:hypothetical protein PAECIP112173_00368 [Paenibacillus sp. JJ-100]